MNNFDKWLKCYGNDELSIFSQDTEALLWLKLKTIVRKKWLNAFVQQHQLHLTTSTLQDQFRELYTLLQSRPEAHSWLEQFIRDENRQLALALPVEQLVSELYKLRVFDWGGSYQNNLDRYLVNNFIKTISSFEEISKKIDTEIHLSVANYVLCSWYNHWSSILIEHLFKEHPKVLPTIGMIKKVDFFVDQVPFDLKVTYLPIGYIAQQRKQKGLKTELSELKTYAKQYHIHFDAKADDDTIAYEITQKLSDAGKEESLAITKERHRILTEVMTNPKPLIRWLYENQGDRRFDAANRIFLILVDTTHWHDSWQLKRNLNLLKPSIEGWLNTFRRDQLAGLQVEFNFTKKTYCCFADVIFVVKR